MSGSGNVVNGTVHATVVSTDTYSAGDTISGTGTGNVLNLTDSRTGATWTALNVASVSVSDIQTLNLTSGEPVAANTVTAVDGFAGVTALNVTDKGGSADTAANTTAITLTDTAESGATESVQGGSAITVTANGVTSGGTISIGTTTAPTGVVAITANEKSTLTGTLTADVINVKGGTTVTVTANLTEAVGVGNTVTGGAITVTGTSTTTSVTVNQTAAATASSTVAGVIDGSVTINDVNAGSTSLAGTISNISLANYATATISDNGLTALTLAGSGGTLMLTDALTVPTVTTLALNVNGLNVTGLNDAHNEITTLNVVTGGTTASTIGVLIDSGLTTLNVSGTQNITLTPTSTIVTAVNVSGGAGLTLTTALGATETFTSTGTGTDVVTISAAATVAITGNGTTHEEIVWNGTAAPAATAYLGTVTGFHVLGIGAATTAGESFDLSAITGFTSVDVQANVQVGTETVSNITAGSALSIDGAYAGTFVYQTSDSAGATDSVALTLGTAATTAGFTVAALTLQDNAAHGIGNVSVVANATTAAAVDNITTFLDASLTSLSVSGTGGFTVGNNVSTSATSLTISGSSTGTAGITFGGGLTDTSLLTLTLSGTNSISLGTVTDGTNGITISGAADNANASLALAGVTSTGHADTVTLGNGNDVVTDTAAAAGSTVTINLGNGNDVVTVGATATNTVSVGTGHNNIIEAAGGNVAVTFGAHSASIVDNVTVGAATSATIAASAVVTGFNVSGVDTITLSGDAGATGAITVVTPTQLNTYGSNPGTLAAAVAGVLAGAGGNLAQHAIAEFQFQTNAYFVEQAGATGSTFAAGDTVVELTGTPTFTTATTASAGVLSLHG